jgi:hypothetical protein
MGEEFQMAKLNGETVKTINTTIRFANETLFFGPHVATIAYISYHAADLLFD